MSSIKPLLNIHPHHLSSIFKATVSRSSHLTLHPIVNMPIPESMKIIKKINVEIIISSLLEKKSKTKMYCYNTGKATQAKMLFAAHKKGKGRDLFVVNGCPLTTRAQVATSTLVLRSSDSLGRVASVIVKQVTSCLSSPGQTGRRPMSTEEQLIDFDRRIPSIAWKEDQQALAELVRLE